ncbi:hypothetical protein MNBD_GAMMA09-3059 [hydrothermal vent metagenome]|uniref:Lipoprotein n=1 Tax=hydrothermal vent metagenome TaxID=652676 RepID=A0A3B0XFV8_9ZZZZ
MMKKISELPLPALLLSALFIFLTACSSDGEKRPEYMQAYSVSELEVPPRLTQPDTRGALQLPKPADKADCN